MKGSSESLGVGLYSMAEAARLLRTPRRTLARWGEGYVQELRAGTKRYEPVIGQGDDPFLTFGDLVELLFVREFRQVGVPLNELREVAKRYRREWEVDYPLATRRFATDGRRLLLKQGEFWKNARSGQVDAFFEEIGRQLVHVGDLAVEWRPLGNDKSVVLNPGRAFGKPIEDASGAHTIVLAQALEAEKDAEAVAWWYGTTAKGICEAAEFENTWLTAV